MKYLLILLFLFSSNLISKEKILICGDTKFRISLPLIGFNKIYYEKNNKWIKFKDIQITDEHYLIKNIKTMQKKCAVNDCITNIFISKTFTGNSHLEYIVQSASNKCQIDGFDIKKFLIQEQEYDCFDRKIGLNLEKGYCKITEKD